MKDKKLHQVCLQCTCITVKVNGLFYLDTPVAAALNGSLHVVEQAIPLKLIRLDLNFGQGT